MKKPKKEKPKGTLGDRMAIENLSLRVVKKTKTPKTP